MPYFGFHGKVTNRAHEYEAGDVQQALFDSSSEGIEDNIFSLRLHRQSDIQCAYSLEDQQIPKSSSGQRYFCFCKQKPGVLLNGISYFTGPLLK